MSSPGCPSRCPRTQQDAGGGRRQPAPPRSQGGPSAAPAQPGCSQAARCCGGSPPGTCSSGDCVRRDGGERRKERREGVAFSGSVAVLLSVFRTPRNRRETKPPESQTLGPQYCCCCLQKVRREYGRPALPERKERLQECVPAAAASSIGLRLNALGYETLKTIACKLMPCSEVPLHDALPNTPHHSVQWEGGRVNNLTDKEGQKHAER